MFRTVIVNTGERIQVRNNWLVVLAKDEEQRIPIEDIYCLVLDNQQTIVTVPAITALTNAGIHMLICDDKHMPTSAVYAHNTHYRPLNVLKKQIAMVPEFKDTLWKEVVRAKLYNQARVLEFSCLPFEKSIRLYQLMDEVEVGDIGNREGIAAKWYFRALFGSSFLRFNDDGINKALNYGYSIIRSAVAKTLTAYGYNSVLGIHHINESNPFNLADDLMEPLRPLVDIWVDQNHEELLIDLTKQQRKELINLVNHTMLCDGKKMRVRNAIDKYISSFTSAIETGNAGKIHFPILVRNNKLMDDTDG